MLFGASARWTDTTGSPLCASRSASVMVTVPSVPGPQSTIRSLTGWPLVATSGCATMARRNNASAPPIRSGRDAPDTDSSGENASSLAPMP